MAHTLHLLRNIYVLKKKKEKQSLCIKKCMKRDICINLSNENVLKYFKIKTHFFN